MKSAYEVLHLTRDADLDLIRLVYKRLALRLHPDRAKRADRRASEARLKELNWAYETLRDPNKREEHDAELDAVEVNEAEAAEAARRAGVVVREVIRYQTVEVPVPMREPCYNLPGCGPLGGLVNGYGQRIDPCTGAAYGPVVGRGRLFGRW